MFICTKCGRLEESPRIIVERHGFTWGRGEERLAPCSCGGDFDVAEICKECGEYVPEESMSRTEEGLWLCEECYTISELAKQIAV
jgi:hypothetical protein